MTISHTLLCGAMKTNLCKRNTQKHLLKKELWHCWVGSLLEGINAQVSPWLRIALNRAKLPLMRHSCQWVSTRAAYHSRKKRFTPSQDNPPGQTGPSPSQVDLTSHQEQRVHTLHYLCQELFFTLFIRFPSYFLSAKNQLLDLICFILNSTG